MSAKIKMLAIIFAACFYLSGIASTDSLLYYRDQDVSSFNNILSEEGNIYAIACSVFMPTTLYFYAFDQNLNLINKKLISRGQRLSKMISWQDGFLIMQRSNRFYTITQIDKSGNILCQKEFSGWIHDIALQNGYPVVLSFTDKCMWVTTLDRQLVVNKEYLISGPHKFGYYPEKQSFHFTDNRYFILDSGWDVEVNEYDQNWNLIKSSLLKGKDGSQSQRLIPVKDKFIRYPAIYRGPEYLSVHPLPVITDSTLQIYDLDLNPIDSIPLTSIPRYKYISYLYQQELILLHSQYSDTLLIMDSNQKIRQELSYDFDFYPEAQIWQNDNLLLAGSCSHTHGSCTNLQALLLKATPHAHNLSLYPDNSDITALENAWENDDFDNLKKIVSNWYDQPVAPKKVFDSLWEQEAYSLFQDVYPLIHQEYWQERTREDSTNNYPYYLLPDIIQIDIVDEVTETKEPSRRKKMNDQYPYYSSIRENHIIKDFRPDIDLNRKTIQATPKLTYTIQCFLDKGYKPGQIAGRKKTARFKFLEKMLMIKDYHGFGIPQIFSLPNINRIVFNPEFSKAIIASRKDEILCEKIENKWTIIRVINAKTE